MTKLWSATTLVALGLLSCLAWTNVLVQGFRQKPSQQSHDPVRTHSQQLHDKPKWSKKTQSPEVDACFEVSPAQRVPCGEPDISETQCGELDCCYEDGVCFFGKAVTVQCTSDGYFIVVAARTATQPSLELGSTSLRGEGEECTKVAYNSLFCVYHFPVTACGTEVTEDQGAIVYANSLTSRYHTDSGPGGIITRDSDFKAVFRCIYKSTAVAQVNVELGLQDPPLPVFQTGPASVMLRIANGQCLEKGCPVESYYNSFYTDDQYPITKILRDQVYVQVEMVNKNDPNTALVLNRCWATASAQPHSMPQWDILLDGCPNLGDYPYLARLLPMDYNDESAIHEHYKRFMFHMFAFVDSSTQEPTTEEIYIHCSTSICLMMPGSMCQPICALPARKKRAIMERGKGTSGQRHVISSGAVKIVTQ